MPIKTSDPDTYETWFRTKVREALDDPRPGTSQSSVMAEAQAALDAANMPKELGNLLDKGIDEHFGDQSADTNARS